MPDGIRWVGLDVHARESTFAIFDEDSGEVITRRVVGRPHELLPWLGRVERPTRMIYEAGPTGYGLARRALAEGIELGVCAPSKTERPPADRIKTDKRDAIRLARLLAAGELTLVTIPSVEREQLRDLVRCREDIRADLVRARHRIGNFLLRREIYWEGTGEAWTRKHRAWLTSIKFADHASRSTLADYLHAHDVLISRRDQVEADLAATLALTAPCAHTAARITALLIAGGVVYLILGDLMEAILLLIFASLSVVITIVQESRSERVLEALRNLASPRALGEFGMDREYKSPDGRSSAATFSLSPRAIGLRRMQPWWTHDLMLDESLLTGESLPVRKVAAVPELDSKLRVQSPAAKTRPTYSPVRWSCGVPPRHSCAPPALTVKWARSARIFVPSRPNSRIYSVR